VTLQQGRFWHARLFYDFGRGRHGRPAEFRRLFAYALEGREALCVQGPLTSFGTDVKVAKSRAPSG